MTAYSRQGAVTVRIAGLCEPFPLTALAGTDPLITSATAMTDDHQVVEVACQALKDLCETEPRIGLRVYQSVAQV